MSVVSRLRSLGRALFFRRSLDRDMAEEWLFHVSARADDLIAGGLPRAEAMRRARAEFGSTRALADDGRDARGLRLLDELWADVRYGLRVLRRSPGSSGFAVASLALGIGANSAIFSAIDTVLLKPLPYPAADRLVSVYEVNPRQPEVTSLVGPVRLEDWNRANRSFDGIAGSYFENVAETSGSLPERAAGTRTSRRFFDVLGSPAALGRTFTPEEEAPGGPRVVVISDGFWRRRLSADPDIVGRALVMNGVSRTVIGVMPPSFKYPSANTDVWLPSQMMLDKTPRDARFYTAIGRLKPGVAIEQARDDLNAVQRQLGEQYPKTDKDWTSSVVPLKEEQVGGVRRSLWILSGAVLLVLLAACGNVACLLLADATRRETELSLRFALGAHRRRIVRQLLIEGLLLSVVGSTAGLLLARWGIQALRAAAIHLPRAVDLSVDARLVAFTLTIGVLTTLVFALAPALQATRNEARGRLVRDTRGQTGGSQRLQRLLVVAQIALAVVLLVGAGLLIRSFTRLQQVSTGFVADGVLAFRMSASWSEPPQDVANRQLRTLERLQSIPGVTSAAMTTVLPSAKDSDYPPAEIAIAGRDDRIPALAIRRQVSAGYFKTLGIPVLQGGVCEDDPSLVDGRRSSAVVVNQTFAARFFPGTTPVGHRIVLSSPREITGIVADAREQSISKAPQPVVYSCGLMPFWPDPHYVVRVDPARPVTMSAIREALREIEPRRAVYAAAPLAQAISDTLSQARFNTILLATFGATTLALAAIGLYGVLSHFVTQKRREIGVRIALGARPAQVLAPLVRHGTAIAGAGVAIGLTVAFGLARFMSALVFEIAPHDPATFALAPAALAAVAIAAIAIPARRAIRLDPTRALRDE